MARILVISAHPDDETMAMGGTIVMHAERGDEVYLLETTRGEGGEVGEPPLTTVENLGAYREGELRAEMLNKDDQASEVRDITAYYETKQAAAMQHRTQHAMFLRNSGTPSVEVMVPRVESFKRW